MRVQNVVHAGLHSDATLGLAMDAPSALHLAYGLYETILYSHKLYQVVVALVLQGVLDTAADSVSPSFALSAEAEQEGERRLLLEELIDLRDRLRSSSNSVLRVVDTDGYVFCSSFLFSFHPLSFLYLSFSSLFIMTGV
jgi:hypothetical protein